MTEDQEDFSKPLMVVGRYAIYGEIASGGMASVHLGRLLGPVGFSRTVAIKRLHAHLAKDPEFTAMFLDEARLAARIRHPNVVSTLDVGASKGELFLVMDYVHGEALGQLLRQAVARKQRIPLGIAGNLLSGMLQGLHAAHEARSDRGEPLGIVHRDVSPQNLLVGMDGAPRLVDFGVAKAMGRVTTTRGGQIKGKIAYMAPEQVLGKEVTRRTDVWGAGAVLWQVLTGEKLFSQTNDAETLYRIIAAEVTPPSRLAPGIPPEIDEVVMRALAKEPDERFQSAHEMAVACEKALPIVSQREVAEWMAGVASPRLSDLAMRVAEIESLSGELRPSLSLPPIPQSVRPDDVKPASFDPFASTVPPPPSLQHKKRSKLWPMLAAGGIALGIGGGIAVSSIVRTGEQGPTTSASAPAPSTESVVPTASASDTSPVVTATAPASIAEPVASAPPAPPSVTATTTAVATAKPTGTRNPKPKPTSTKPTGGESLYVRE
jgi:serine/threonine-protein kinase